ncbi:hypothetical protein [Odoribacter splanchnicus]|uniref:hypothetical protein n=1 Tax=Odoribacter splanchnicus TaxID=28118 RepID=UPI003F61DF09
MDLAQEEKGWIVLGDFLLPQDETTVTMTDRSNSLYVAADAVKFTKLKSSN